MRIKTIIVGLVLTSGLAVRAKASTTKESDDNEFREDVIACEEAVSHVNECCAGLTVNANVCRYSHYYYSDSCGCDSTSGSGRTQRDDVRPVLGPDEAHGIASVDCATMQAKDADGASRCATVSAKLQHANEIHESSPDTCEY